MSGMEVVPVREAEFSSGVAVLRIPKLGSNFLHLTVDALLNYLLDSRSHDNRNEVLLYLHHGYIGSMPGWEKN